jgi:hypothetical protein
MLLANARLAGMLAEGFGRGMTHESLLVNA